MAGSPSTAAYGAASGMTAPSPFVNPCEVDAVAYAIPR